MASNLPLLSRVQPALFRLLHSAHKGGQCIDLLSPVDGRQLPEMSLGDPG